VNNAGITRDQLLMRMKRADWDAVLTTNLTSRISASSRSWFDAQAALGTHHQHHQRLRPDGQAGQANYAASKAGLIGLTMAMAREVASRNITCNAVAPVSSRPA